LFLKLDKTGIILKKGNYVNGKKDGVFTEFYISKKKKYEHIYKLDALVKSTSWYENQQINREAEYPGTSTWYDKNGKKLAQASYTKNQSIKTSTIKVWLNGKLFDPKTIIKYKWEWVGKREYNNYGTGIYYFNFTNKSQRYSLELLYDNRWLSIQNSGAYSIDANYLPQLVFNITPAKRKYKHDSFHIQNWDGTHLIVNGNKWLKHSKD
jgi:antitoxin component YwqK of YwqJK toxin-antitoxin module